MLEQDSKNYHVWSYRQWLVKRFDLFDKPEELEWTAEMIEADVRNNSAWNHRYYLVVGGRGGKPSEDLARREIEYASSLPATASLTDRGLVTPRRPSARHHRTRAHGTMCQVSCGLHNCPN
jgi:hypothetical protein